MIEPLTLWLDQSLPLWCKLHSRGANHFVMRPIKSPWSQFVMVWSSCLQASMETKSGKSYQSQIIRQFPAWTLIAKSESHLWIKLITMLPILTKRYQQILPVSQCYQYWRIVISKSYSYHNVTNIDETLSANLAGITMLFGNADEKRNQ